MMYQREWASSVLPRFGVAARLLLAASLFALPARAEESPQIEARKHFAQGVAFVDEQRLPEALAEFEKCYALYPAYATLYNIAQLHAALGDPVAAVEAFEKYLADGGAAIAPKQRARVEAELATQRQKVGEITIQVTPPEAELRIDDKPPIRASAPLTLRLAAGRHQLSAALAGYRSEQREAEVQTQGHVDLSLSLEPEPPVTAPVEVAPPSAVLPRARDERAHSTSTQRIAGYVLGGVGLVGAGVGVAIAVAGQAKHNDALDQWSAGDKAGARSTESASSRQKTAGYIVIGVGGAASVAGAILIFTAHEAKTPSGAVVPRSSSGFRCTPWVSSSLVGASLEKSW